MLTKFWLRNLKGRQHSKDLAVGGRDVRICSIHFTTQNNITRSCGSATYVCIFSENDIKLSLFAKRRLRVADDVLFGFRRSRVDWLVEARAEGLEP